MSIIKCCYYRPVRQAVDETNESSTPAATTASSTAADQTTAALVVEVNKGNETKEEEDKEEELGSGSAEEIKLENIEKCQKCLKPTFKSKHAAFCGKCAAQNIIDSDEAEELSDAIQCKKCLKAKYKARHEEFCSNECTDMEEDAVTEADIPMEKVKQEESATEDVQQAEEEEATETPVPTNSGKNKKNQSRNKNKNKNKKERNKFASTISDEDIKVDEATTQSTTVDLGPLGNLIKALVVQNTWVNKIN